MKHTAKTQKRSSNTKAKAHVKTVEHTASEKVEDVKNWSDSISQRFLSEYAIPFTRLVEAKLVSLQHKV